MLHNTVILAAHYSQSILDNETENPAAFRGELHDKQALLDNYFIADPCHSRL